MCSFGMPSAFLWISFISLDDMKLSSAPWSAVEFVSIGTYTKKALNKTDCGEHGV